jgi:type II secretory pathway component GspD/PulD (secretin)
MSKNRPVFQRLNSRAFIIIYVLILGLAASYLSAAETAAPPRYRVFSMKRISGQQGRDYLQKLELGTVSQLPNSNTLLVTASARELIKVAAILRLVDSEQRYVIKAIYPAVDAETLPSNAEISSVLGDISIGSFTEPASNDGKGKAIIDIHNDAVITIAPEEDFERIITAIEQLRQERASQKLQAEKSWEPEARPAADEPSGVASEGDELFGKLVGTLAKAEKTAEDKTQIKDESKKTAVTVPPEAAVQTRQDKQLPADSLRQPEQPDMAEMLKAFEAKITAAQQEPQAQAEETNEPGSKIHSYAPEPVDIGNETLELDLPEKLNIVDLLDLVGKYLRLDYMFDSAKVKGDMTLRLQGPIKVRDLYPLMESVLKFRGFVMAGKIQYGDVIITRIFQLKYINTTSAKNLLTSMKLGASITAIDDTGTLIVTEYAYRMGRVEELLSTIDIPGKPKHFRFRQLQYTMAKNLAPKIKTIAEQLGAVSITIAAPAAAPAPTRGRPSRARPAPSKPAARPARTKEPSVYLDVDERTNRILMIGTDEQLTVVDELVDTLDVAQKDLRLMRLYDIQYVGAEEVKQKLEELGIIGGRTTGAGARITSSAGKPRTAKKKPVTAVIAGPGATGEGLVEEPQVVIIESTNSLLVNATPEQHEQIAMIIGYVDSETLEQAIPYEIYPLENQSPEDLGEVLNKLISETIKDREGKIEKVVKKQDDIVIVPDEKTFSLIVYASRKNQEWIKKLIKQLDRRRPQVLIDVTLVEVSRTDLFDLDLQLASKFPVMEPGGTMDKVGSIVTPFLSGTRTEAFSSPLTGAGQGFYSDRHIQALLTAMQTKSYGRVLAKPKILVNDGQPGIITGDADKQDRVVTKFNPYEAGITLSITPNISEGDLLLLEVGLTRSDFGETPETGSPPDTTKSEINTVVTVPNNKTIILGGLIKLNQSKGGTKVPLLGDIPILGGLFRSTSNTDRETKLYVFVKANILRPDDTIRGLAELEDISERNRMAFEKFEQGFQGYPDWPGVKPEPIEPIHVLDAE